MAGNMMPALLFLSLLVHDLPHVVNEQEVEYTLVRISEPYNTARMMCRLFGGTLAIINDTASLQTVSDIMRKHWSSGLPAGNRDVWVGLHLTDGGAALVSDDHFCPEITNSSETLAIIDNRSYTVEKFCYQLENSQLVRDVCENEEFYICQRVLSNNCTTDCHSVKERTSYSIHEPGDCPENRKWIPTITNYETMTTTVSETIIFTTAVRETLTITESTTVLRASNLKLVETLTISTSCEGKLQTISPMASFPECSTVTVTSPFYVQKSCNSASMETDSVSIKLSQTSSISSAIATNSSFTWTCRYIPIVDYESDSVLKTISSIQDELKVDKKLLSQTVNKKVSIPDHRPSATAIGTVGLIFIGSVLGVMLILDFKRLSTCLLDLKKG